MHFKWSEIYLGIPFIILLPYFVSSCADEAITLDEHFIGCCRGRPKYTSEPCIDELLANGTFSSLCLLNCMYKAFQIYDGFEIDLAAVKTFLDEQIADEDFHIMYMNAFERCSQIDKTSLRGKFSFIQFTNIHNCDDYSQYMDICIWYHTFANCPEIYATNDEGCNSRRAWVNECLLKS